MADRRPSRLRYGILALGILLVLTAASLLLIRQIRGRVGIAENKEVVAFMQSVLPDRTPGTTENRTNAEMPAITYGGQDYVALLEIPCHGTVLPIRSVWDRNTVRTVPCRYQGNPYLGTLIIGGVDDPGQFDFIADADIGDEITLTDMRGCQFRYTVKTVKHAKNAHTETLTDEDTQLTLFAHSSKTKDYILVRCSLY